MNEYLRNPVISNIISAQQNYFIIEWNEDGKFNCPESFLDLTGYSTDEILNLPYKHHSILKTDESETLHNSILNFDFESNVNQIKFDYEFTTKSGKSLWFREYVAKSEYDYDAFVSVLFDITDFKRNELKLNEIIESKKELNNSKDKLISIISHDLRAPFSSLLGFSEILLNEPNLPINEREEYLKYIYDASQVQLQMVNHLLDWTRLQTGTMKFEPRRLDIKDIVDNCVSVLTGSVIRKNIEIKVEGEGNLYVLADERLINQVVTNLLSNAVKFTPTGKKITVSIGLYKDNMIEVIVADEGVGIDENHQDKLFRIDTKYSKTGTAGEKGSGFGLTLVKEIVEKHNGTIWFYSELNKGSEFHFTIPKSEDTALIIEEHSDLQNEYQSLFDESFTMYTTKFINNGFEALNFILEKTPALLITYHKMPLMNGIQLVTSLRDKDIHRKTRVIVLGDDISDKDKNTYLELGVKTFIPVNTDISDLKDILSALIS